MGPVPLRTKMQSKRVKKVQRAKKMAIADCFTPDRDPRANNHILKTINATKMYRMLSIEPNSIGTRPDWGPMIAISVARIGA